MNKISKPLLQSSQKSAIMVERASYKSIRDQLIALSVDIEDKSKICSLLERKIENERELLGSVDASLNAEYNEILEV